MSEKIMLRVSKGCLLPADDIAEEALRKYKEPTVLTAVLTMERSSPFHRFVFGRFVPMVKDNIKGFESLDNRSVLERIQLEGNIACKEMMIIKNSVKFLHRSAKSLSFNSMDQTEFWRVYKAFCAHISKNYWPSLTPEQVEEMTGVMPNA